MSYGSDSSHAHIIIDPLSADLRHVVDAHGRSCTKIPHEVFADTRLSLTAVGLYAYLLSFAPDEDIPLYGGPESREEINAALRELEAAGYIAGGLL